MKDINYTPKHDHRKAIIVIGALLLSAALCLVGAAITNMADSFFQLAFIIFSAVAIFFTIKYVMTSYTYTLTDRFGPVMLIVTQTSGKKISTMCRIPCGDISEICAPGEKPAPMEAVKRYDYSAGLGTAGKYTISSNADGTNIMVKIEVSEEFVQLLRDAVFAEKQRIHEE